MVSDGPDDATFDGWKVENILSDKENKLLYEELSYKIRGAAFNIRKKIGLGHKETIYQ